MLTFTKCWRLLYIQLGAFLLSQEVKNEERVYIDEKVPSSRVLTQWKGRSAPHGGRGLIVSTPIVASSVYGLGLKIYK